MNKIGKILIVIVLPFTLFSCKRKEYIRVFQYYQELSNRTGIINTDNIDEVCDALNRYGVIRINEEEIDSYLTYKYLKETINRFAEVEKISYDFKHIIKDDDYVYKEDASRIIDDFTKAINNKTFETTNNIKLKDDINIDDISNYTFDENTNTYNNNDNISFEDVFEELEISSSEEINLDDAIIIDDESLVEESIYENEDYTLLGSKRRVLNKNGYRISYKITSGVIDARISKNNKNGLNSYLDFTLSNIKPSYKWKYKEGRIEDAYFKVDYKLTSELGVSKEKRKNYTVDLSHLDTSSILSLIKSSITPTKNDVEATIKICTIKTPIPSIPLAYFNIDVLARMYVSGKIDLVAYMTNTNGFEIVNNNFRLINDGKQDIDFNIEASARAIAGVNFNLEAAKFRLMDLEIDAGAKASCKPIVHIYDNDGNVTSTELEGQLEELEEISKDSDDVRICADVSLNWILDITLNTSKSILYKFGLSRSKEILNKRNQILGNMTHIENGHFVKKCTRNNKKKILSDKTNMDVNKIILSKYSIVIDCNKTATIPLKALPNGYNNSDLIIISNDESIVSVNGLELIANKIGSTKIDIKTKDDKYQASINVLVSTG